MLTPESLLMYDLKGLLSKVLKPFYLEIISNIHKSCKKVKHSVFPQIDLLLTCACLCVCVCVCISPPKPFENIFLDFFTLIYILQCINTKNKDILSYNHNSTVITFRRFIDNIDLML